jgi:hypothetical protein
MLHVDHVSLDIHKQHDLILHNTNKYCLYVNVVYPLPWWAWIVSYQSAGCPLAKLPKGEVA